MKIVSHFKTEQDVKKYLQAVEKYTDWVWFSGTKPMEHSFWRDFFKDYQNDGGFCISFGECFLYGSINGAGNGRETINFEEAILELKKQSMENEMKEGDLVYVSNESEKDALKKKNKRIILRKCSNGIICIHTRYEEEYKEGRKFRIASWKYVVPVHTETKKTVTLELTDEQLEKIKKLINQ